MRRPRQQMLRYLVHWMQSSHFETNTPKIIRFTRNRVDFNFKGLARNLRGKSNIRNGISIYAYHKGDCWSMIEDFTAVIQRSVKGYYCDLRDTESRIYYKDRKTFFEEECFIPLKNWAEGEILSNAKWLEFSRDGDITWGRILDDLEQRESEEFSNFLVPLRGNGAKQQDRPS